MFADIYEFDRMKPRKGYQHQKIKRQGVKDMESRIMNMITSENIYTANQCYEEVTSEKAEELTKGLKLIQTLPCGVDDEDKAYFYSKTGTVSDNPLEACEEVTVIIKEADRVLCGHFVPEA